MRENSALVGASGFVGSTLKKQRSFSAEFTSSNIEQIASSSYDLVVCAAAPANMWMANRAEQQDADNLERLATCLASADIGRLVLVSTIAVYENPAAGPDEASSAFENVVPYGKNRRELEVAIADRFPRHTILRLPSLFGQGLKKNFLYDLINPAPSYLSAQKWEQMRAVWSEADKVLIERFYHFDPKIEMYAYARGDAYLSGVAEAIETIFFNCGFVAPMFANSRSEFQYYNLQNIWADIQTAVAHDLPVLNVCSEPMSASHIGKEVAGFSFENSDAPLVKEDMRTLHADKFGRDGSYLYRETDVLDGMREFYKSERTL